MGVSAEVGESDSARRVLREGAILPGFFQTDTSPPEGLREALYQQSQVPKMRWAREM